MSLAEDRLRTSAKLKIAIAAGGLLLMSGCQPAPPAWSIDAPPGPGVGPDRLQQRQHASLPDRLRIGPEGDDPIDLPETGPLVLSVEDAVLGSLRYNRALSVQQLEPVIAATFEQLERAVFDPAIFADTRLTRDNVVSVSRATGGSFSVEGQDTRTTAGVVKELPTGTTVQLDAQHARSYSSRTQDQHQARVGITVTQALLQGFDPQANLARIRQARLDTLASEYQLRGFAETLIADVEDTYWQLVLAQREIEIVENSLEVVQQQEQIARDRIEVGTLPETELAAAQAEVALRRQALIDSRSEVERVRLLLLRLVNPPSQENWDRTVVPSTRPSTAVVPLEPVEKHIELALRLRPELHEAKLLLEREQLEVLVTRSGLLPRLDLFIAMGKTGYADTFSQSVRDLDGKGFDFSAGIEFYYPLGNRAAEAVHRRSTVSRFQAAQSIRNLEQLIELEVRQAYLEVERTIQQIDAIAAVRALQEEVLRTETEKFRVGRSTSVLVAQAQRDLLSSQLAEVESVIQYRQAVLTLYRLEGSLLIRRGIWAPGQAVQSMAIK